MKKEIDMTEGNLFGKLLLFSLPLVCSGILQLLFNAADLIVIGRFSSTASESLAAVSSNGALIELIVNIALGFSVGANVVMAQAIGARDGEKAERVLHTSVALSLVCGVFLALIGFFFARTFLIWMQTDPIVLDKATTYLKIYFLGSPANVFYNFGASVLRAKGDTKRPLFFLAAAGVVNVGLNLVFVIFLQMDVSGVSLATIVSQYISAIAVLVTLFMEKGYCKLTFKRIHIVKKELAEIIRIGLPSGVLGSFFSIANVMIQRSVNTFGYILMAANSTGANLEGFCYVSMNAVTQAATTFSGQNYGAGKPDRIKKTMILCSVLTTLASILVGGLILLFAEPLAGLYSTDPEIISHAVERMTLILPLYFVCGVVEVLVGGLRGMGYSVLPMIPTFFCVCVFRIVWIYTAFAAYPTPTTLYYSYPISWIINLAIDSILFAVLFAKTKKKTNAKLSA